MQYGDSSGCQLKISTGQREGLIKAEPQIICGIWIAVEWQEENKHWKKKMDCLHLFEPKPRFVWGGIVMACVFTAPSLTKTTRGWHIH